MGVVRDQMAVDVRLRCLSPAPRTTAATSLGASCALGSRKPPPCSVNIGRVARRLMPSLMTRAMGTQSVRQTTGRDFTERRIPPDGTADPAMWRSGSRSSTTSSAACN